MMQNEQKTIQLHKVRHKVTSGCICTKQKLDYGKLAGGERFEMTAGDENIFKVTQKQPD